MKLGSKHSSSVLKISADWLTKIVFCSLALGISCVLSGAAEKQPKSGWRQLPLISQGHIAPGWVHVGYGGFTVDGDSLKTECDPKGLGLLVYKKEEFGNCQLRIIFKAKAETANSGVYVRIADGILNQVGHPGTPFVRDAKGNLTPDSLKEAKETSEKGEGAWYAVHHGYEVQIKDAEDKFHRTGAIYSLAPSSATPVKPGDWRTMVITLSGNRILVDVDGQRVTTFDPDGPDVPKDRQWFEPKRQPARPEKGYLGLQNHDPGDVVWFKEVSVRPITPER